MYLRPSAFRAKVFRRLHLKYKFLTVHRLRHTTGWRVSGKDGAAEILGISPKTLESMMQRLCIQKNKKNA
jgi:transcriptional regulator with GAF, ATPase, and Fis domain